MGVETRLEIWLFFQKTKLCSQHPYTIAHNALSLQYHSFQGCLHNKCARVCGVGAAHTQLKIFSLNVLYRYG